MRLCNYLRLGGTGFRIVRLLKLVAAEVEEGADASEAIETAEAVSLVLSDVSSACSERAQCEDGVRRGRFRQDDGW